MLRVLRYIYYIIHILHLMNELIDDIYGEEIAVHALFRYCWKRFSKGHIVLIHSISGNILSTSNHMGYAGFIITVLY